MQKTQPANKNAPTSANWTGAEQEAFSKTLSSLLMLAKCGVNGKQELSTGIQDVIDTQANPAIAVEIERQKIREQWLREEIRASRTLLFQIARWGVMTLAAVSTALYYVRRDVLNHLSQHNVLPANGTVPPGRWFVGTAFLCMIAIMFCTMSKYLSRKHVAYRTQLLEIQPSYSGIKESPTGGNINLFPYFIYLAFPILDFGLWFYFRLTNGITIPW
jgi:hypothetical protein